MRCSLLAGAVAAAGLVAAAPKNHGASSSALSTSSSPAVSTVTVTKSSKTTITDTAPAVTVTVTATASVKTVTKPAKTVTEPAQTITMPAQTVTMPAQTVTATISSLVTVTDTINAASSTTTKATTSSHSTTSSASSTSSTVPQCSLAAAKNFAIAVESIPSNAVLGYIALTNSVETGDNYDAVTAEAWNVAFATTDLNSAQLFTYEADYTQLNTVIVDTGATYHGDTAVPIAMRMYHDLNGQNVTTDLLTFYGIGDYYDDDDGVLYFDWNAADCSFSIEVEYYSAMAVVPQLQQGTNYITINSPGNAKYPGNATESDEQNIRLVAVPAP